MLIFQGKGKNDYRQIKTTEKSSGNVTGKNEYISAPCNGNGICGKCIVRYKSGATEPTKQDREFLSEKQLEQGYRLACQSYPTEEYKVEIPELEETIEVLSQWENQRTEEILKNTAEGTAEKTENAIYGICIDIGTTTLAALLVNLKTEADCQTAVSVNHQRTYGADVISRIDASNNGKNGRCSAASGRIYRSWSVNLQKKRESMWHRYKGS